MTKSKLHLMSWLLLLASILLILCKKDEPNVSVSELPIMVTSKRASIPDWPNPDVKTIQVQVTFTGTASVLTK